MRTIWALVLTIGLVAAGCATSGSDDGATGSGPSTGDRDRPTVASSAGLERFASCDELADYAAEQVDVQRQALEDAPLAMASERAADESAEFDGDAMATGAPVPTTAVAGEDFSTTNNQEVAVDEADVVKTDGELVLTTVDGTLQVLDATSDEPALVGSLALPTGGPHEMLLHGDRLLVLSTGGLTIPPEQQPDSGSSSYWLDTTVLTEVDLRDPAEPTEVSSRQVDGSYRTARASDGTARIVVTSYPAYSSPMPLPMPNEDVFAGGGPPAAAAETLLPAVTVVDEGGALERTPLIGCDEVSRAVEDDAASAGVGTVTVLSIDLTEPLDELAATTVMGDAEHVYASAENLYLAGSTWDDESGAARTEIHQLSLTGDGPAEYVASGSVDGYPLNQFAFSEHDGRLRVATTDDGWGGGDVIVTEGTGSSDSAIAVLERSGDQLTEIGRVDGMGEGEQIYSVRYLGDTAYVVTFRRTDPLYTVDLSDPSAPAVVGELKIPGYSSYLHPVGEGLLLGIGQDAGEDGRVRGTQVSLFDVSDPAAPVRLQQFAMPSGSSDVEYDHRAFLWWGAENLAVVPHNGYDRGWSYNAALGLEVTPDAITERGRVVHDAPGATPVGIEPCPIDADCAPPPPDALSGGGYIVRSLVVNRDQLWTVSERGIEISDVDTLTEEAWIPFPG